MHFNARALLLPVLFAVSGVLAQQTAEATSGSPDVTYPDGEAIIFCSNQDCTGTCVLSDGEYLSATQDDGEAAPNDMGFLSIYWYDPYSAPWVVSTCVSYFDCEEVNIGPNTCYNLYENGVPTDFGWYWYELTPGYGAP